MFSHSEQKRLAYRMQVFAEVVRLGSFTAAATSLGHTKSAISHYISQLEVQLNCRLLNRTTRRLRLTAVGEQFAQRCHELTELMSLAVLEVQAQQQQPQGHLRITAPETLAEYLLIPSLSAWRDRFPGYQVELQLSDQHLDLMQHGLDIALRVGDSGDSSYRQLYLGQLKSCAVAKPELYDDQSLAEMDAIFLPWQKQLGIQDEQGQEQSMSGVNILRVNTVSSAISAAVNGMGVAVVPRLFVAEQLLRGELQQVGELKAIDSRPVYLLHAYDTQLPLALRHLAEQLKERLQQF